MLKCLTRRCGSDEWGIGNTKPEGGPGSEGQIKQALHESELGLPVIVHAYLDKTPGPSTSPNNTRTLPLALFLLAQTEYWYLGISSGWMDKDWDWWPEYDAHYGKPLGRATQSAEGWKREFEGCSVFVTADLKNATISLKADDERIDSITLSLRNGSQTSTVTWDPRETAMLIIDPWSYHWCKTFTTRAFSQHRLFNAATEAGRKAGMTILWSPTDAEESYIGWPQYERAHNIPRSTPIEVRNSSIPTGWSMTPFQTRCECGGVGCMINAGETRMDPLLVIGDDDYIVGGGTITDVYSILKHEGIKHLIYMGYAENICMQYKAEGMLNMWKLGFDFILARCISRGWSSRS